MKGFFGIISLASLFFVIWPTSAPAAEKLGSDELSSLVNGKTWKIQFIQAEYWDWRKDGVVCVRLDRMSKCADEGRWRLDGDKLCWKLTWLGKTNRLNKNCIFAFRAANDRLEAHRVEADGSAAPGTFFEFSVAD
jgi:hypothetical protein